MFTDYFFKKYRKKIVVKILADHSARVGIAMPGERDKVRPSNKTELLMKIVDELEVGNIGANILGSDNAIDLLETDMIVHEAKYISFIEMSVGLNAAKNLSTLFVSRVANATDTEEDTTLIDDTLEDVVDLCEKSSE